MLLDGCIHDALFSAPATNVLVRLIVRDHIRQTERAEAFVAPGAWVSRLVLAETIWVLESVYDLTASQIAVAVDTSVSELRIDYGPVYRVYLYFSQGGSPYLFTLGYQGLFLEQFLNKPIENSVSVLCDVRRNALSMKYGFSKRTLERACDGVGVDYVHIPELGVDSSQRKQLNSQADYDSLFRDYSKTTLLENQGALESITRLIDTHGSVALTCFEADSAQCHRSCVANTLFSRPAFEYPISHL